MRLPRNAFLILLASLAILNAQATLLQYANQIHLNLGTAVGTAFYNNDTTYIRILKQQFNTVVCENEMKPSSTEPAEGQFNFTQPDSLVAFAQRNNMKIRGHCLVWYSQEPSWLSNGNWTRTTLLAAMKEHINGEVSHYKGKILEWDVVNEAIQDGSSGALRSFFYETTIGPDYIDSAFVFARRADSNALLFINDYSTEVVNAKSTALYNEVQQLLAHGIPVQGVGFQCHIQSHTNSALYYDSLKTNFDRFAALGIKIAVTELDVGVTTPVTATILQNQASTFGAVLRAALAENSSLSAFVMWGFTDKYSWLSFSQPCIYTSSFQPKPAYDTLLQILQPQTRSIRAAAPASGAFMRITGTTLQANASAMHPVMVSIYRANGRLVKKFRTSKQSIDLRQGLSHGCYMVRAELFARKIAGTVQVY